MKHSTPINELVRMTLDELRRELKTRHAECAQLRLAIEMGAEKNHAKFRALRRDIARMTMVLRKMEYRKGESSAASVSTTSVTSSKDSPCPEPRIKVQRPRSKLTK